MERTTVGRLALALAIAACLIVPTAVGGNPHLAARTPGAPLRGIPSRDAARPARSAQSGLAPLASSTSIGWASAATPTSPPGLFYPSLASDPEDGYVVLFGGCTAVVCGSPSNQTWEYFSGRWTELFPVTIPPAREEAVMVYDPVDHYVVMYGGQGAHGPLTDTWSFRGGEWSLVATRANPGDRVDASLTFDTTDGYAVLFGGSSCNATCGTWTYRGGTWGSVNTTGEPPARYGAAMAFNVALGKVLLFGGISSGGSTLADTWEYYAGTWNPLGSGPPLRSDAAMAYNAVLGVDILFGGEYITLSNFPGVTYNDTWEFGATGWVQLTPPGGVPAEYEGAMAVDPEDGSDIVIGGCGPAGCPGSATWVFGAEANVSIATSPASCGSVNVAGAAHANGATLPLPVAVYAVSATPCAHYSLTAINGSGGVVTDFLGDAANVSTDGSIDATFSPMTYNVTVEISPSNCGSVELGADAFRSGSIAPLPYGSHGVVATGCPGEQFASWSVSGRNLTVASAVGANTTLAVGGNGTITAVFTPSPSSSATPGGDLLGIPVLVWLAVAGAAAILVVAVAVTRARRGRRPPARPARRPPTG